MTMKHGHAVALMVLVTFLWSIAGWVKLHLTHTAAFEVTFWRSAFTLLTLLILLPAWQGVGVFRRMPWGNRYFWLSGLCWSVMFTAFMVAMTMTTVANVLVTLALGPLFTAVLSSIALRHRLPLRTWGAIAVAGVGIVTMYGSQFDVAGGQHLKGVLVALCVPLAASVQWTVVQKSRMHGQQLDLVPSVLLGAALCTLYTLPLAMPFQASQADLAWLALLGSVQLAIPCVLSVIAARTLAAPEVALLALLEVIFGIGLAWLGGEVPPGPVLTGGALVIGALVVNEWLNWRMNERFKRVSALL